MTICAWCTHEIPAPRAGRTDHAGQPARTARSHGICRDCLHARTRTLLAHPAPRPVFAPAGA